MKKAMIAILGTAALTACTTATETSSPLDASVLKSGRLVVSGGDCHRVVQRVQPRGQQVYITGYRTTMNDGNYSFKIQVGSETQTHTVYADGRYTVAYKDPRRPQKPTKHCFWSQA